MTTITYIAKRQFVTDNFLISSTDISASDVDNSFNSSVVDLSGIADDFWIKVSGGTNIGWHQVVTATANKITTNSTLNTESTGVNITLDGYEHGEGAQYQLETASQQAIDTVTAIGPRPRKSIDGTPETIIHRVDTSWDILTGIIMPDQVGYWDEFIHSVLGGESFTLDPYGTIAVPDKPVIVVLDVRSLKLERLQNSQLRQLPFKARQL